MTDKAAAARELMRRQRARTSLHTYSLSVDVPTVPFEAPCPDEDLLGPASGLMAIHHAKILDVLQLTANTPFGRALIMAPPGSAKSLYTSVLLPTWEMGRRPGSRIILTSYASTLAERQARRAIQLVQQSAYAQLWDDAPAIERSAASDWSLTNKSEMLSMGLTAGITGNRASGAIIDDPVAGREEADSAKERQKTLDAYQDDLLTRLLPGAWLVLIMTRWNEQDLAGSILPESYKGESGQVKCRDGLMWNVLNIQAKAERHDDPLQRKPGQYLWPEWFPKRHWEMVENASGPEAARSWSSLYQQRPSPQGSGRFTREMINLYDPAERPSRLNPVGASDYAVTEGRNDFTEHGVFGMDEGGNLWALDWFFEQCSTDKGIEAFLDLANRWKVPMWFNEGGVIDKATRPAINRRMRERVQARTCKHVDLRSLPSMQDKVAKLMPFQARAASGTVWFPRNAPWTERVIQQLLAIPAGRHDDAADVCGLIGRAVDQYSPARPAPPPPAPAIKPFTAAWIEYNEDDGKPKTRYR